MSLLLTKAGPSAPGGGGAPSGISLVGTVTEVIPGGGGTQNIDISGLSLLEDDILIFWASGDNTGPVGPPTGFTTVHNDNGASPSVNLSFKFMGATPDTSVDGVPQIASRPNVVIIRAYRGVDTTTPQDATATTASGASGMPNCPSITTVTDGAFVIACGGLDDANNSDTALPSGYSDLTNLEGGGAAGQTSTTMICHKEVATAGAEDPAIFGGTGSDQWNAVTMALRPA